MALPEDDPPESLYNKEEIELKLNKIDDLQMQINGLKIRMEQLEKRVKRLQDHKKE